MVAALEEIGSTTKHGVHALALLLLAGGALAAQKAPAYGHPDMTCSAEESRVLTDSIHAYSLENRIALRGCIDRADSVSRARRLELTRPEAMHLATMFFDIPEYHDEGRLAIDVERPTHELGPVAGIYASPFLGGFTRPAQIYEQGLPGTLAALVTVDGNPGDPVPASYANLQLRTGMNCVYLYVDPPPAGMSNPDYLKNLHYTARVSHPNAGYPCDRSAATATPSLDVVSVRSKRFSKHDDYPAVARFDTDVTGVPIMSVRCLNAFCEIGVAAEKTVRTPGKLHRPNPDKAEWDPLVGGDRKQIVKGWHDEQHLAMRGADHIWRASEVKALMRPDPAAADYDSADFEGHWKTVGTIEIFDDVPATSKYFKWGLKKGENVVQLRHDPPPANWLVQMLPPKNARAVAWHFLLRTVHTDMTVPAIARFRWTAEDDGVWAPCGNACCKASGGPVIQ